MRDLELDDGVVRLREWADDDAAWYADSVQDPLIQQFTTDSPTLTAEQVLAAMVRMRASDADEGLVICDAVTGSRLGNIALRHDGSAGEVSYWVAAQARGRGVATRALALFSAWSFRVTGLEVLWLCVHRDNVASQRAAMRAGYRRDPGRDKSQQAKGSVWPMLGYVMDREPARPPAAPLAASCPVPGPRAGWDVR
jgi:[ribosomal protein S5]-alanine N-acetyltransferase